MTAPIEAAKAAEQQYHNLKTDPDVFQAVLDGAKTFEIRLNDRSYAVGDVLGLCETKHTGAEMRAGAPLVYTGRECQRFVSHVLTGYGLADGWCCLSFRLPNAGGESSPVADERAAVDPCGYVAVKRSAVDWLKDKFPALTIKAGLCERIGGRLYTLTRLMRDHDAALASAPVAGEAQPVADAAIKAAYVEHFGHEAGWLGYKGSWFIEGYRAGRNAAPQASADDLPMHKLAVQAMNDLLVDIRTELGLTTTQGIDGIIETIRALKTQADKDGGGDA